MNEIPQQPQLDYFSKSDIEQQVLTESKPFNYRTLEYPVEVLVGKLKDGGFHIPPYQRSFVWQKDRQSYFIESVLLQMPISPLFGAQQKDGVIEVVDGSQRIRTLEAFLDDKLKLTGLEKLDKLNGRKFSELPNASQRFLKSVDVRVIVLRDADDFDVQFEIFRRINTTSAPLTDSEIRRGAYPGPFWDLVAALATNDDFVKLTPMSKSRDGRFEREELALRYFSYVEEYKEFIHDVRAFMNRFLQKMNQDFTSEPHLVDQYTGQFIRMVGFVKTFMPEAFPRGRKQTPRTRFEAISVGVSLALKEEPNLVDPPLAWLNSKDFDSLTRAEGSNSGPKLIKRVEFVRDSLLGRNIA